MQKVSVLLLTAVLLFSCANMEDSDERVITTSIPPFKYFTEAIAGEGFKVNVIVPPGASPATFEPTPSVIRGLKDSELLIFDGYLGYELAWGEKLEAVNPSVKKLVLADSQQLIYGESHHHGDQEHYTGVDPHFWVSPEAASQIAIDILRFLTENYPEKSDQFKANWISLDKEISGVDFYLDSLFNGLGQRSFMIFHPALTYLARDYNLEQLSVETDGKEPTPTGLKEFIDHGRKENIGVIFVQREFDKKNALTIASEIGARVVEIDPLSEDWPSAIRTIGLALKEAL